MKPLPADATSRLALVEEALLSQAFHDAEIALKDGTLRAGLIRANATKRAAEVVAAARADGARQAEAAMAAALARQRREAHAIVLRARADLYSELRRRCVEAAQRLRDDPEYSALLSKLELHVRMALGPEATVHEDSCGGVTGKCGSRTVDLTLPTLVEREVDDLGEEEVALLWRS